MISNTVVRLAGFEPDEAAFFADWTYWYEYAKFTIPRDHPLSNYLINQGYHHTDIRLHVTSTDEIEWHVDKCEWTANECTVTCIPHRLLLKRCILPDEYLLDMGMVS